MKIDTKLFYLHYILFFIDEQYKICNNIDETFCSQSLLGSNLDSFYKFQSDSYQMIFTKEHYLIRSLKNSKDKITPNRSWFKYYVESFFEVIFFDKSEHLSQFIVVKNIGKHELKTFFLKEFFVKMKRNLFEKITQNPFDFQKKYTSDEIFSLIYSYAFSLFDNRIVIMKNILFLISQELFDLEEINHILIQKILQQNPISEYAKKFRDEILSINQCDQLSKIDQFLNQYYDSTIKDKFLDDLYNWKMAIANFFVLIQ